jgi:hypothetical protein
MNAKLRRSILLVTLLWLAATPFAQAQSTPFRQELLALLPDDFGVCIVVRDLQGHYARLERADWFKAFRGSPLGKSILESPELQHLEKWQGELKKHFDLDWATLRDDILGDTLILAYSPGSKDQTKDEHGLILLHVRKPERLVQFIDELNTAQQKSGEVKSLTALQYKGATYHCRQEKSKAQYYFVDGSLAAVSTKEEAIKALLDKRLASAKDQTWAKRFRHAGAEQAFLTLCVNPRQIQPDFGSDLKGSDALPSYWRALEGIFLTLTIKDDAELRLSLQADPDQLPKWARGPFTRTTPASSLWQRFPEQSILTVASRLDFADTLDGFKALLPEPDRKAFVAAVQNNLKGMLKLDPFDDIVPNVGPDWGICVLPAKSGQHLPVVMVAVAVQPGSKKPAVDQTLYQAVHAFAGFALLDYNAKNPDATIRLQTMMQDKVEVAYLTSDKAFPAGVQPACALKEGFLIVATSPDAIANFRAQDAKTSPPSEAPLLRLSTRELAKLLEQRRDHILRRLPDKDAKQHLENVISLANLFEIVTLSQHGAAGQASWTLRLAPARADK